jgi:DNA-binding HxlR family transcriptional regulator
MPRPRGTQAVADPEARLGYQTDPIGRSVRALGQRWTLLLLRDLAFLKLARFNELLRNNPGLGPRVLSRRLREMQQEGLVVRIAQGPRITYRLTERGEDAVYILLAFLRYGLKHHRTASALPAARVAHVPGTRRPAVVKRRTPRHSSARTAAARVTLKSGSSPPHVG